MKNQTVSNLPKVTILENDGTFDFLKGKSFFAEKTARAKEALKNMKLPPR
jgi:hypothetical protein